jgi:nucleoside-diphosphate-sugar epimerase
MSTPARIRRFAISRILITGAAGFIGQALATRLAGEGHELILIDRLDPRQADPDLAALMARENVTYFQADLTDATAVATLPDDVGTIFHLAAVIGVENVFRAPDRVLEVNAVSTINLFNYARRAGELGRLVFASTSEAYAGTLKHFGGPVPTPESVPLTLEDVAAPRTTYALSKIYGEAIAFAWRQMHGVPVTILRYHNVYGPRMGFRHVIPETFAKLARTANAVDVASAEHTRAFCYIDDAVEATVRCATQPATEGRIVHVGSADQEIAMRELVRIIARLMRKDVVIRPLPPTAGSPERRCPDTSLLAELTGFRAGVSLNEGLARTWAWYRKRLPQ